MSAPCRVLALAAALLAAVALPPRDAEAQIRVATQVSEDTGGLFRGTLTSALRALPDLEVVPDGAESHYVVQVMVLCLPEPARCEAATSYAATLSLLEPLTRSTTDYVVDLAFQAAGVDSRPDAERRDDDVKDAAWHMLRLSNREIYAEIASFGRATHAESVRGFVERIDARCFARERLLLRGPDPEEFQRAIRRRDDWLC